MADRFITGFPNKKDWIYIVSFFLLLSTPFIFNFLQSSSIKSYGSIYLPIYILVFAGLGFAWLSKGKYVSEVIFGNTTTATTLYRDIAVGAIFGAALVSSLFIGSTFLSFFQVGVPFAISPADTATTPALILLVVIGIFAPEVEESMRASFFVPTFTKIKLPIVLLFAGIITLAIPGLYILTIGFFVAAFIIGFSPRVQSKLFTRPAERHMVAILISAVIFGLFHIYSYGSSPNVLQLMFSAFLFAVTADLINWKLQSTIAGRIAHSINNSFILAYTANIPYGLAALVVIIYALIIILIFKGGSFSTDKQSLAGGVHIQPNGY
jgi:hypothetical protein